jgi:DNA transformation protein and related proteins
MGFKGDKQTSNAAEIAELIEGRLEPIGGVTTKKMFGGFGIFHEGKMFGLVSPVGAAFLKFDDNTQPKFEAMGGERHSKMPYFSVPNDHIASEDFIDLLQHAITISK